ncbi:hypothetical protein B0J11DRAFT_618852 [Dendryphion nanum]|uniref:Uncharacterized protein n=1 Tax=Dendryphion nanum TaxID=256645 RepID=A0A9P9ID15_9PLEO|nr:hypothetical protein B0J11DRAFT_618852 [Dendryphion nanum]
MYIPTSILLLATLALPSFAADCFQQSGCKKCASFQQLQDLKNNYCANKWNQANPPLQYNGYSHAQVFGGPVGNKKLCQDAFDDIIGQCYGKNDGGDFNYNGWDLRLGFCQCD